MKEIYLFDLKRSQKALLAWVLCQLGLILAGYVEYYFVFRGNADIPAIMSMLPPSVANMLGISSYVNFSDQAGFYCLMSDFAFDVMTAYAVLLGHSLFFREESCRTADFLYTRPIDRRRVAASKYAAGLTCSLELNLVTLLVSALTFGRDERVSSVMFLFAFGSFLLQTVYFSAGTLFAVRCKQRGSTLAMLFWMLTILGGKFLTMAGLKKGPVLILSLRDYFPAERLVFHTGAPVWPWVLSALWIILLTTAALRYHEKKDF